MIIATVLVMMCVLVAVALIASYVLNALGYMKCMQKAGEPGWKAWVPFYSDFIMYRIVGLNGGLIAVKATYAVLTAIYLSMYVSLIGQLASDYDDYIGDSSYVYEDRSYNYSSNNIKTTTVSTRQSEIDFDNYMESSVSITIVQLLSSLCSIGVFVVGIFFAIHISKAYGLGGGYIAGMILVPTIFILIIGFGSSEYKGSYSMSQSKTNE